MMMMMIMMMSSSGRVQQISVVAHLVTNFKLFYGIGIFSGAFTKCRQWLLFSARSIQSIPTRPGGFPQCLQRQ